MEYKTNQSLTNKSIIVLLMLSVVVVPLIVKLHFVPVSPYEFKLVRSTETFPDVFSYYKTVVLMLFASLIFMLSVLEALTNRTRDFHWKSPVFICMSAYVLFVVLSSVFSPYPYLALHGASQRYESVWVLLGYVTLFLASYLYINERVYLRYMVGAFFISMCMIGTIGFFQFIGQDFFATDIANKLVLGKYYAQMAPLQIVFKDVYSTLYNPNCIGLYASMFIPFCVVIFALMPLRSILKYVSLWFALLMAVNLIGSNSAGGFIATAASLFFLIVLAVVYFIYTKKYKHVTKTVSISIATLLVFIFCFVLTNGYVRDRVVSIVDAIASATSSDTPYFLKSIAVHGYEAEFVTSKGNITLVYDKSTNDIHFRNDQNVFFEPVSITDDPDNKGGKLYNFAIDNVGNISMQYVMEIMSFSIGDTIFMLHVGDNGFEGLSKDLKTFDFNTPIKSIGFKNKETFATGRGFIWSRSIPLALDSFFLGSGPDTFVMRFPQNDVLAKAKAFGNPYMVVDKPHNFYLQTAVTTGLLSMVCLVVLFMFYICQTIKLILKTQHHSYNLVMQVAFLGAIVGYLVALLSTDSVVSVAPVFWVMLGTGFGINKLSH